MSKGILLGICVLIGGCQYLQQRASTVTPGSSDPLPEEAQYWVLQAKTYDEMNELIEERLVQGGEISDSDPDAAKELLREALEIIFARPNSDNMVSQLVPQPRSHLRNLNAYENILTEIARNAAAMSMDSLRREDERATALIVLENLMEEMRPEAESNEEIKKLFRIIADARIDVDDKAAAHLRMKAMMKRPASPSAIAEQVLKSRSKAPR